MDAINDVRLLKMLRSGAQYANKESYGIHITSYIVLSVGYGLILVRIRYVCIFGGLLYNFF